MKKLDVLTPLGVVAGIVLLGSAIWLNGGIEGFSSFFDIPSLFIVLGGVLAAMLVTFPLHDLKRFGRVSFQSFRHSDYRLKEIVDVFVHLSQRARKDGLLSLEKELVDIDDPFVKKGIILAIDGVEMDTIVDILNDEIASLEERHRKGRMMLEKAGDYAPAWGMIGTLIGLVLMLKDLDDPGSLGPNMAIALLTTLYGVLLANLIFHPMAAKLAALTEKEIFVKQVIVEGVVGVQNGQNPRMLEEQLLVFLTADEQKKAVKSGGSNG